MGTHGMRKRGPLVEVVARVGSQPVPDRLVRRIADLALVADDFDSLITLYASGREVGNVAGPVNGLNKWLYCTPTTTPVFVSTRDEALDALLDALAGL